MTGTMIRRSFNLLHRWTGLLMAGFLFIAGLTGSLLAFNSELERLISPQLFATARHGVAFLDLATLAERAGTEVPQGRVRAVSLVETDQAEVQFSPRRDSVTGVPYKLGFTQFFVDPWTGHELGRRIRGDLSQGSINLLPFIYSLHWTLAAGRPGQWIMGIVALIWSLDCFVGFYLTLPRSRGAFWQRWHLAWLVKWRASSFRINFDLHRASGLWLWPLLFIFGWSSVMMNIRPTYERVMRALFDYRSPIDAFESLPRRPNESPRLDWRAAETTGARLMAEQALKYGFTVGQPLGLAYSPDLGAYRYDVRGSRDVFERAPKGGSTYVMFDGNTGVLINLFRPTGEHSGNTVESWLYALHMTRVFGRAYQIFVCALGLVIAMLSVTGVYIWWRKRAGRRRPAPWRRLVRAAQAKCYFPRVSSRNIQARQGMP
jgi:uncharacterized iron-regulated membrane protein